MVCEEATLPKTPCLATGFCARQKVDVEKISNEVGKRSLAELAQESPREGLYLARSVAAKATAGQLLNGPFLGLHYFPVR